MKIDSLTLSGFKSFADRTKVEFHDGITAVVGPNGCGKSNISDALRWVLGEQRASAIRGSRMDEAIFHGTANRKAIHRAEVELSIANGDGILPVPYPQVAIGRTVLRGGESAYEINGQTVRLRDVHDLCRDTGLGANAYSIIEGRMIDAILSDRPEERRALFEEAAEVGRYKDRRRTALRRLDQAHADLQRLEDVISEVASKVRSLARQRGRASRYGELRETRLVLEVAVAAESLDAMEHRLRELEKALEGARRSRPEVEAALALNETEVEGIRLQLVESERERSEVAARLEAARGRLEAIERDRLVTDERVAAARARIASIRSEQVSIDHRRQEASTEKESGEERLVECAGELERLRLDESRIADEVGDLRTRRQELEHEEARARSRLTALLADMGSAGAEAERRKARAGELTLRESEHARAAASITGLTEESDAAAAELSAVRSEVEEVAARLNETGSDLRTARDETRSLRERLSVLEGELSSVTARAGGLAGMLSAGKDLPPVVARLLADRKRLPGVHGTLAEFMEVPAALSRAVEAKLGTLLFGLVVDDWKSVLTVRAWLANRDETDGLVLLPLDPGPGGTAADGSLLEVIAVRGPGDVWVRALLAGTDRAPTDEFGPPSGSWVADDGSGRDLSGVVRLGQPSGARGMLQRRTEHQQLLERRSELEASCSDLRAALEGLETDARTLAERAAALEAERERLVARERETESRAATAADVLARTVRRIEELDVSISQLREMPRETQPDDSDRADLAGLRESREALETELASLGTALLEATGIWERERDELQETRLRIARAEAAHQAEVARLERVDALGIELDQRQGHLEEELATRQEAVEIGAEQLKGSEEELERLFRSRAELEEEVRRRMDGLEERRAELERREAGLRQARANEREASERRHALELERTELHGRTAAVRERLETEWERPLDELRKEIAPPSRGDPDQWAAELVEVRQKLAGLGPVNMLAAAEYDEEKQRLDFLETQRADLVSAREDLHDSIRRINEKASTAFHDVFKQVRANFRDIFVTLFEGGECDVWLESPDAPLDSAIEISASPRGKRTQRIHLLSGGERTLTALGLLFAIYLAKPSPFCVMDEVDAPLDESNIDRFTAMLERFKKDTQFLVITHNARTIEVADYIYGVTMQEPGVSTLVALDLKSLPAAAAV